MHTNSNIHGMHKLIIQIHSPTCSFVFDNYYKDTPNKGQKKKFEVSFSISPLELHSTTRWMTYYNEGREVASINMLGIKMFNFQYYHP